MEYADLDITIAPGHDGAYEITAPSSLGGADRATMRLPFSESELEHRLRNIEMAIKDAIASTSDRGWRLGDGLDWLQKLKAAIAGAADRGKQGNEPAPIGRPTQEDFGKALFLALFAGKIHEVYATSLATLGSQGARELRVRLHIEAPELASLPWEYLCDPDRDYLCLTERTPLIRYPDLPQPMETLTVRPPLRVLGMVASPIDPNLATLDVAREKELVEQALADLKSAGLVELTWLSGQSWHDIQVAMYKGPWHVFHFVGHGGFDSQTREGVIALADEQTHRTQLVSGSVLGRLLRDQGLQLVVLNSCEGARTSKSDLFSGAAPKLIKAGIPAVVAMQYVISDKAAVQFARVFYEGVAHGAPIEMAVTKARVAVSTIPQTIEWATPVLYMRCEDGKLFDVRAAEAVRVVTPPPVPAPPPAPDIGVIAAMLQVAVNAWRRLSRRQLRIGKKLSIPIVPVLLLASLVLSSLAVGVYSRNIASWRCGGLSQGFQDKQIGQGTNWEKTQKGAQDYFTVNSSGRTLDVTAHPAEDLKPTINTDAPMLLCDPWSNTFTIETKVTIKGDAPPNYVGAGLVVWLDGDNFVRLELAQHQGEGDGPGIEFEVFIQDRVYQVLAFFSNPVERAEPIYLRLECSASCSAGNMMAKWGTDGKNWRHYSFNAPFGRSHPKVGLDVVNGQGESPETGTAATDETATFGYLKVS